MPLTPQLVPVPFSGGIDTKTDSKQVLAGRLTSLQNGQFQKGGQISKRYGYDILSTGIEGGGDVGAGAALSAFEDELLLFDGASIYTHVASTGNWLSRGVAVSVIASDQQIIRQASSQQLNPDVGILNGIAVYAWEDSRGGVRYAVIDTATGAYAVSDGVVDTLGSRPKVVSMGGLVWILYTNAGGSLFARAVNPRNPTVIRAAIVPLVDGRGDFFYDAAIVGSKLMIAYLQSTGTGTITVAAFDSNFALLSSAVVEAGAGLAINGGPGALAIAPDAAQNAWVVWATGTAVRVACVSYVLAIVLADTLVDTADVRTLAIAETATAGLAELAYEVHSGTGSSADELVKVVTVTRAAGVVVAVGTLRSVGLASKLFMVGSRLFVNVTHESSLQSTYFTVRLDAQLPIVAKIAAGVGGGLRTNGTLSEVPASAPNIFGWANLVKGKLISEANTVFSLLGVNGTTLDFADPNRFLSVASSRCLLFVGGVLQSYDGIGVVEAGFHLYPEGVSAVAAGADGFLSTGAYQYAACYEWTDNRGQIQRSAPSVALSVAVTATNHVTITVPTLRLTLKQAPRANVSIVIYRTAANGSLFQRVTSTIAPLQNNPAVDYVSFVDLMSDANLAANELIYTTGGVLLNAAPPACSLIAPYQNRVFLAGLEDPNLLWFSKNRADNSNANTIPTEFAAENTIAVDPRGGAITAIGLLDANLVIFKASAIFILTGDGPNDTGLGDIFGDPQLVTSDSGCTSPNSIVSTPLGMLFQSEKGICLLDRSLAVTYIGAPVEDFNELEITSATLLAPENQIAFTTSAGVALVYDYYFSQWSTWTNHQAEDGDIFGGSFVFLKASGKVYQQNQNRFDDGGSFVSLSFETPDFSFPGLNGWQRVFRAFVLGTYRSAHSLAVSVAHDWNPVYTESTTIPASSNVTVWGGDATWGASSPWGGGYTPYQFRIDFKTQKCSAIRLKIADTQQAPYGEGYAISALSFEVGVMARGARVPKTQTTGSA